MKNLKWYTLPWVAVLSLTMLSCDDDDNKPAGAFEKGVFVVNEGNFGIANGTMSFIDPNDGTVTQDLFGTVNNGLALGDVVQSMSVDGDRAFVVVNNSNKIEVVNANTFVAEYTLEDLALPRYFTTLNGKGYVTEWVSFSDPGRVTIIDLDLHSVTGSITTDFGAENILAHDDKLYVSNNFSTTVSVIDPATEEVIKTIQVGSSPGSFVVDNQDMIWVICGGGYDLDYNPLNDGKLVRLDPAESDNEATNSVTGEIELGMNVASKAAINQTKDSIFYFSGKSVYAFGTSASAASSTPLVTEASATSFYGIGLDPESGVLYLGDSKGFVGNGTVYRYTTSGTVVDKVTSGIGPSGFVFK